jgi:putative hemolysin
MTKTILQALKWSFIFCAAAVMTGCASQPTPTQSTPPTQPPPTDEVSAQLANPASENCILKGGTLAIQKRGDGAEYGVCYFEDNRQCEEWALMRGECPLGGLKVTGFLTEAGQYCAITGGVYASVTSNSDTEPEQGTCTFKTRKTCNAADYFAGTCDPDSGSESFTDPFAYCSAVGTVDAPDTRYTGDPIPDVIVQGLIQTGVVTTDAPADVQKNAVWRCMDNKVWACHFGANLPCLEKADASHTPTPAMEDFCKANPASENIPAAVTGRATVYEWKCSDTKPEVVKQVIQSDSQGFLADFWHELTPK